MRKTLLPLLLSILLIPQIALADGGVFIDYEESVYLPSQKAVVAWEGGAETLILSTQIKIEDVANVGWVVPIPSSTKPEVEEGNIDIFYDLANLFRGEGKGRAPGLGLEGTGEVEVIEIKEVDIYDIAILKATGAEVLVNWLNDNSYVTPESAVPILQEYCEQEDFYFIANKIDLANKYQDLKITEADKACSQGVSESIPSYSGPSEIDYRVEAAMEELTACEGASFAAVKLLVELEMGVATPLKITFSPEMPFYPLEMSSINDGDTVIDVYVFSDNPVKDRSQLLTLPQMTENTASFGESYNLNQKYVTYLSYTGDLADLSADSWFEFREYDRSLDPNYVSFWDRVLDVFYTIISFGFYYGILIIIFAFAAIGFVVVLKTIFNWFKRRRKK